MTAARTTSAMRADSSGSTHSGCERRRRLKTRPDAADWQVMGDNTAAAPQGEARPATEGNAASAEVMLVDDEPLTARGYARALTAAGYKVTIAAAGREGAALAR